MSSRNIVFYISNHGFGHASRNIPIIEELSLNPNVSIHVKSGRNQIGFIKQSLNPKITNIIFHISDLDIGLILTGITIDKLRLEKEIANYINSWGERCTQEEVWLKEFNIDLIISDIIPWIFIVSNKLRIKSILISNFTWVEIYKEYLCEDLWKQYLSCYKMVNKALLYPMYNREMLKYFTSKDDVGISCRKFNEEEVINIKNRYDKPIVFVSVGRSLEIQKELDVSGLPFKFIVTEGIKLLGKNVEYLPINIENTQEYIKASEFIITKAGWGTCAEAILAKKPMLLINRDSIAEDRNTTQILEEVGIGKKINFDDIDCGVLMEFYKAIEKYKNAYNNIPDMFNYDVKNIVNKIIGEV